MSAESLVTRRSDGKLVACKDAPLGGQAVLEGVMMRGLGHWAVAVRKPATDQIIDGERDMTQPPQGGIVVERVPFTPALRKHRLLRLPLVRGVVALVESMKIGFKALNISANAQLSDTQDDDSQELSRGAWVGTIVFSMVFAIGLFFLLPAVITKLIGNDLPGDLVFVIVEKLIRVVILLAYLFLLSRLHDLRRIFEYHGAEHKAIFCYEAKMELTPENAQKFSRFHPRCGTSFLLIVMVIAIVVFAPLGRPDWYVLLISRVVGIPIVTGIAFEVIKWFGKYRTKAWSRALMWPGLQLQRLTTREPDLEQLAVAIAALQSVLEVEQIETASKEEKVGMEVVA